MSLAIKSGVRLHGLSTPMVIAVLVVLGVYEDLGFPCVMTSGIDGKHADGSFHYSGNAGDFRTNHVPVDKHPLLLKMVQDRLPTDFFAQIEVDHLHVQWKPKATYGV